MVLLFAFCSEKVSRTPGNWEVHCLRNAVLWNQCNTFHKLNAMLSAAFVTLVGTWKSCIDITLSKPWNTDITVTNGLLNQFWRSRESPEPSVPYRLKWEPAYCISMMFFLWIPLWVCFFPLPTPCNVFLWKVFHKWFAQTSCVIWDALTKTLSAREKKNPLSSNGKLSSSGIRRLHQWRLIVRFPFSWFWSYNKGLCLILCDVV